MGEELITEKYKVNKVEEVKCWTTFYVNCSRPISMKRHLTNRNLVDIIKGKEIEVTVKNFPIIREADLVSISYRGSRIYPVRAAMQYIDVPINIEICHYA